MEQRAPPAQRPEPVADPTAGTYRTRGEPLRIRTFNLVNPSPGRPRTDVRFRACGTVPGRPTLARNVAGDRELAASLVAYGSQVSPASTSLANAAKR